MSWSKRADLSACAKIWKKLTTTSMLIILTVEFWENITAENVCGLILDVSIISLTYVTWISMTIS